jgi:hypothetical protein
VVVVVVAAVILVLAAQGVPAVAALDDHLGDLAATQVAETPVAVAVAAATLLKAAAVPAARELL